MWMCVSPIKSLHSTFAVVGIVSYIWGDESWFIYIVHLRIYVYACHKCTCTRSPIVKRILMSKNTPSQAEIQSSFFCDYAI